MFWIIVGLSIMNVLVFFYVSHVLYFTSGGLDYLRYAYNFLLEKNDIPAIDEIVENDAPELRSYITSARSMLYIIFSTFVANMLMLLYISLPDLQLSFSWTLLSTVAAFANAYVLIGISGYMAAKIEVHRICQGYVDIVNMHEENSTDDAK